MKITLERVKIDMAKKIARLEILIKIRTQIDELGLTGANQVVALINQWEKGNGGDLPEGYSPLDISE